MSHVILLLLRAQIQAAKKIIGKEAEDQASRALVVVAQSDGSDDDDDDYDSVPTCKQIYFEKNKEPTIADAARAFDNFRKLMYEGRPWEEADTDDYREKRAVAYFNAGTVSLPT